MSETSAEKELQIVQECANLRHKINGLEIEISELQRKNEQMSVNFHFLMEQITKVHNAFDLPGGT